MIHKFNQKHINVIRNIDNTFKDDMAVVERALEILAEMCDPDYLDTEVSYYIATDDDGKIVLKVDA